MDIRGTAIQNVAISTAQIITADLVLSLDAGNTASYPGTGSTWSSLVSPQYNATLVNSPVFASGLSASFDFNGVDQYAEFAHNAALKPTAAITMEQWISADDWTAGIGPPTDYFASLSCTQGGGYAHYIWAGTLQSYVRSGGVYQNPVGTVFGFAPASFHQVATTFDGQYTRLYLDGVLADTEDMGTAGNAIQYDPDNSILIGAEATGTTGAAGQYWSGRVAITRIYSAALSASEIRQNYVAIRGRYQ